MKKLIIISGLLISAFNMYGQQSFEWTEVCGHPFYGETNSLLDADADGNLYFAGSFMETAGFGDESVISAGGTDIFIAKYNAQGELLRLRSDGGEDFDYIHGLSVNDEGIFTIGTFYGNTVIGSEAFTSMGSKDIYLARYGTDGNFLWAKHIGSPKTDYVNAVDTDPFGNMIITGHYYDSISFGDTMLYAAGGSDIFLAKYDASGNRIWLRQAGGSSSDLSYSISCDTDGNIVFTGSFFFDIMIGDTLLTTSNPTGVFMAKLDNSGALQYAVQLDGNELSAGSYAAFDGQDNIYFTGNFAGQLNLGPYTFVAGAFNVDVFVTRYTAGGDLLWADHGQGAGSDQLISMSVGPLNDLYITGHYLDDIHFSNLTLDYTLCCGSVEIFIVHYTPDGIPDWGEQISGERGMIESMCKNVNDELFLSGMFQYELAFGDDTIHSTQDYSNFLAGMATGTMTATAEHRRAESTLKAYPVPAGDYIRFEFPDAGNATTYQMIDMYGRILLSGNAPSIGKLDISSIPAGQYLLRLSDPATGYSAGTLILKQ